MEAKNTESPFRKNWDESEYVRILMKRPHTFPRTLRYHIRNLAKKHIDICCGME